MFIRVITAVLFIIMIAGVVVIIANERLSVLDTSYEIIAFSIGILGIIIGVMSQIEARRNEKRLEKMSAEIMRLEHEQYKEDEVEEKLETEVDTILKMDKKIYHELAEKPKK